MQQDSRLLIFGLGYTGRAIARAALGAGFAVTATTRGQAAQMPGVTLIPFNLAAAALDAATHVIATAAPDAQGDPVLARYAQNFRSAGHLRYIGYLSTTGVYGDAMGGWVDEDTPPNPGSERARRRVAAEAAWADISHLESGQVIKLDIFRLAGIYGPGRSMLDDLRVGEGRRIIKPGHLFGRIHRDDIAAGVLKAMQRPAHRGVDIFNFTDDEPAASADVVLEAARLLGLPPPPPLDYAAALPFMSPMAQSFWAENRRVANQKTKEKLGLTWLYPSYREGLSATIAQERAEQGRQ